MTPARNKTCKPRCCGDCEFLIPLGLRCAAWDRWRAENCRPCAYGKLRAGLAAELTKQD